MTPFGERIRILRDKKKVTLSDMAKAIGVSSAYLSALEHGRKSRPSWYLVQRIIAYFNLIWDDAEEIVKLANLSRPKIIISANSLSPKTAILANKFADHISDLKESEIDQIDDILSGALTRRSTSRRKPAKKA